MNTEVQVASPQWSVALPPTGSPAPGSHETLAGLCSTYWTPLYAFVRREGYAHADAQDLVQGFFARLLQDPQLSAGAPHRCLFWCSLLRRLKHFLSDERKKAKAQKRGGGQELISLDAQVPEGRYSFEPTTELTAECIYERRLALILLERTVQRLGDEYAAMAQRRLFEELITFALGDKPGKSYGQAAAGLGLTVSAVKSAIYRLRQRHRALLLEEFAQMVRTPAELQEEIRHLISVMSR